MKKLNIKRIVDCVDVIWNYREVPDEFISSIPKYRNISEFTKMYKGKTLEELQNMVSSLPKYVNINNTYYTLSIIPESVRGYEKPYAFIISYVSLVKHKVINICIKNEGKKLSNIEVDNGTVYYGTDCLCSID